MWVIGAGHGQRAHDIAGAAFFKRFASFMYHWCAAFFFGVFGIKAASLHHEVFNHSVKNGAIVVLVLDVLQKILNRLRGFVGVHLDQKIACRG